MSRNILHPDAAERVLLALAGLKVLDLSRLLPGPYLTRLLADLGADVVKVEDRAGDFTRWLPPTAGDHGAAYAALNHGKRSIVLDLKQDGGPDLFLHLSARADVVVESFRPGVLDRLGVGYARMHAVNPRIILCSISGYGQRGPLSRRAGHDLNYLARAGILSLFGPWDRPPLVPGVQAADIAGGSLSAAIGVLTALLWRERTGEGQHIDIAMTRSLGAFTTMEAARQIAAPPEARGRGLLTGGVPCYRVYETADGRFMALAALEPKFFTRFCSLAGCPHLADKGVATGDDAEPVIAELKAIFASRTRDAWVELLGESDVCCEPVRTLEEALADDALGLQAQSVLGFPCLLADVGLPVQRHENTFVSELGADTQSVLEDYDIPADVIERARRNGVLSGP